MKFTYWVKKDGKIGNQQLYQTATVFADTNTKKTWDVEPRGPGGSGAAYTFLDTNWEFSFTLNTGYVLPSNAFPFKMAFKFDELAQSIEGGAMLCEKNVVKGKVYAMKGKIDNAFVVGYYRIVSTKGAQPPYNITVHGDKLIANGKPLEKSRMSGNQLIWENMEIDELAMPKSGFMEFSPDGTRIICSSFDSEGYRQVSTQGESSPDLSLTMFLNMNPNGTDSKGNHIELVQQNAMAGFSW